MNKEDIKFEIDQLRKDKIIYATEACAVCLTCLVAMIISNSTPFYEIINWGAAIIVIGYTIFMGITNFMRLMKIVKLQKKLPQNK